MADGGVENRPAKSHSEGSEALRDSENELKDVRLKIMMEDNPERKAWFIAAQERLLREEDLEDKLKRFISQNT